MSTVVQVHPEKILKQLGKLWVELGQTEQQGVLRACAMTLIVVATEDTNEQDLGEMLAALMHEHPSRSIVIRVPRDDGRPLEAQVLAQCWMPFGKRQQICCEQIQLTATPLMLEEAAAVIRGLIVPDLPAVLYCPEPAVLSFAEFEPLLPLVTKIIVDSTRAEDSAGMLRYMQEIRTKGLLRGDLAWARLTPWREAVAQVFDNAEMRRLMFKIDDIRILYAHADEPTAAYYLAGWFMHVLGGEPHIRIARGVGPDYGRIARVSVHGEGVEAWVELMETCSIEVRIKGVEQRLVFPAETEYSALREELSVVGRDAVFEDVLGLAALLRGVQQ